MERQTEREISAVLQHFLGSSSMHGHVILEEKVNLLPRLPRGLMRVKSLFLSFLHHNSQKVTQDVVNGLSATGKFFNL